MENPSIGHFYAVPGLVTTNDGNGKAIDATSWRVMYDNKGLKAGVGVTKIETGANDYKRTAAALSYTAERWQAGITREQNKHSPSGDFNVTAVGGSYKFTPKVTGNRRITKRPQDQCGGGQYRRDQQRHLCLGQYAEAGQERETVPGA
ncbi:MAG: hypothetical protein HZT40_02710 [Candidatus Thiothrix singaporensis]|uniref:Uncharacterized protein n=1 Tax=Candidatus Thiothrix singaporensis TaxID=2799669 RepID=A0A7L6ANL2_9GAMM|nr:MAG: hypothetical protein HZT40_02710 [Candidatus Thiothrix singaporensis]